MTVTGRIGRATRAGRRLGAVGAAALLAVSLTSCAAGQHAATADVRPGIDGTQGKAGDILLEGVAIHAPDGASYAAGSNAQLGVTLVNQGSSADTLVSITSPAFTGWGIVDNAAANSADVSGDTGLTIDAGSAQRLGLADLGASDTASTRTVVLTKLTDKLYPGNAVQITFRFAKAGSTTVRVPVQLTTTPNNAVLPSATESAAG